jgi:uncharacterized protein with HEPN domain
VSRNVKLYLHDILGACQKIHLYSNNLNYKTFCKDQKTVDAVLHNLLVIGEAVKFMPKDIYQKHPEIQWTQVKGLRNIIAHEYFGLDYGLLWDIVITKIPDLLTVVETLLNISEV